MECFDVTDVEIFEDFCRAVRDLQGRDGRMAIETAIYGAVEDERARIEAVVREEIGRASDELEESLSTDEEDHVNNELHPKSFDEMEEHPHEEDDAAFYQRVTVDLASANARPRMIDLLRKRRAGVRIATARWLRVVGRLDRFAGERAAFERAAERLSPLS